MKDMDLLDGVQGREMLQGAGGLEHVSDGDRLREFGLLRLEKRRLRGDLIAISSTQRSYKGAGEGLCTRTCRDRTRGNRFKLDLD